MSDLPKGWTICELEKCVDILDNQRVPINSEERQKRNGKVPYYGATGQVGWIDDFLFNEELLLIGEDGAPFFDKSKPIAYIISGKSWVNNHAHVLRAKSDITNNQFLKYFLDQFDFYGFVNGTTRLKLNQGSMKTIPVFLPPLNEQKRIVEKLEKLLGKVEACRARLDKIPTILKRFRQSVLAAACSGKLTADWRAENENGEEWKETILGDVIIDKPKNGYSAKPVNYETKYRVLTLTATTSGRFIDKHFKYFDEKMGGDSQFWIQPDDILVQRGNTIEYVGVSAIYDGEPNQFIYPDLMMRLRANETITTKYLYFHLSWEKTRNYLRENATGTAGNMPKINQTTLINTPILLPPLPEQKEIVRQVEDLFKFADSIEERFKQAKAQVDKLTNSILAKAFRGELVPQDDTDEPASVLLERIKAEKDTNQAKPPGKKKAVSQGKLFE